jgi:hypothetical protein
MKPLEIVYRPLDFLKPANRNARTHSAKQIGQIADSLRAFGWTNPILVNDDGRIIAGHGRSRNFREYLGLVEKYDQRGGPPSGGGVFLPDLGPLWKEKIKEQQDWLQGYVRRLSNGSTDLNDRFVSKYEPPRSKPKKPA